MGLREFLDKRLDWQFDRRASSTFVEMTWVRWRRGPVTVYRQRTDTGQSGSTTWFLYVWDDVGFGVHLPDPVTGAIDKMLGLSK